MVSFRIEKSDVLPLCPHCEREIVTVHRIRNGFWSTSCVYSCGWCRKVLSVGGWYG